MNYKKVYNQLINKARSRTFIEGYTELHHIVPRSEGGSDDEDNLVELTPKEHFVAHKLLYMDNPNIMERVSTMWLMSNQRQIQSGRVYEQIRYRFINTVMGKPKSEEHKRKISEAHKGKPKSKESIEKMKANLPDRSGKNNANYGKGRSIMGDGVEYSTKVEAARALNTTPQNIAYRVSSDSEKWKGWYYTDGDDERTYNLSKPVKGRTLSKEHIEKIRKARTGQKLTR
jgi:hypothetical protein